MTKPINKQSASQLRLQGLKDFYSDFIQLHVDLLTAFDNALLDDKLRGKINRNLKSIGQIVLKEIDNSIQPDDNKCYCSDDDMSIPHYH